MILKAANAPFEGFKIAAFFFISLFPYCEGCSCFDVAYTYRILRSSKLANTLSGRILISFEDKCLSTYNTQCNNEKCASKRADLATPFNTQFFFSREMYS